MRAGLAARRRQLEQALAIGRRLADAALPANFTADVAFRRGGQAVVIELNPLYCSGSYVPAARAWTLVNLGAVLASRAGYADLPSGRLAEVAARLAGESLFNDPGVVFGDSPLAAGPLGRTRSDP